MSVSPPMRHNSRNSNDGNDDPELTTTSTHGGKLCAIGPEQGSLLQSLLQRMNPRSCLGPTDHNHEAEGRCDNTTTTSSHSVLDATVPTLLSEIIITTDPEPNRQQQRRTSEALERLYDLTDLSHKHNRVPLVCTNKWYVVSALSNVLIKGKQKDRRMACLILNNLSIPFENKAVMVLGGGENDSNVLLQALCTVISKQQAESYLCCICLFNLSFLEDAKETILKFGRNDNNNDDCRSLLQTIQVMMKTYTPLVFSDENNKSRNLTSVQGEAIRWATGLIRNVTTNRQGAKEVVEKVPDIVSLMGLYIQNSPNSLEKWVKDSLEDLSLVTLVQLAQWPESLEVLKQGKAQEAVAHVVGKGGIHDYRAAMITCRIESLLP